jgi:hypothetical protein
VAPHILSCLSLCQVAAKTASGLASQSVVSVARTDMPTIVHYIDSTGRHVLAIMQV